jgi:putative DNA primase/helicase
MRPPDLGPDAFAFRQERDEAERARAPSTIATAKPARKVKRVIDPNDSRPKIRLCANDIERIVNECESALIKANRGLYQRDGSIVFVDSVPALAAHGVKVQVQRISERGEQALQEDFSSAACFEKFDARADDLVLTDPPMTIVRTLLARRGRLRLPILSGVINTPTMRADGSILDTPGYDTGTGLLFDPLGVMFPAIKGSPSRDDALAALGKLQDIIRWVPFRGATASFSRALGVPDSLHSPLTTVRALARIHRARPRLWQIETCGHRQRHRHRG